MTAGLLKLLRRHRVAAIWLTGLLTAALVIVLAFSPYSPLARLNNLVFDAYQNLKPRVAAGSPVLVVDIDDESVSQIGQWPWPRTVMADIIDRLTEYGAASIALDIILSEPDRTSPARALAQLRRQGFHITFPNNPRNLDHDQVLADSFSRAPVVSGIVLSNSVASTPPDPKTTFAFAGLDPKTYLPSFTNGLRNLDRLDAAATGIGVFSFPVGGDGVIRQIPLVSLYDEKLYPSLAMEALRVAQGASTLIVRSTGASGEQDTGRPGMVAIKNGHFTVPSTPDGRLWVYYSDKPTTSVISVHELLANDDTQSVADRVAGHLVLIGTSAIGLRDIISTPLKSGEPGVMVHAEIIDQILGGSYLSRPDWAVGVEVAAAIVAALVLLAFLPSFSFVFTTMLAGGILAVVIYGGWYAFSVHSMLLSPILPAQTALLVFGLASGVRLLASESEGRFIRSAFSHYLAPTMVNQLVDNPQALVLGGENRELTMLFCDIRGFTGISEGLGPQELTEFLNNFLTPMTDVLLESGATIDKYMGDAIMAFWNAPIYLPDHRQRACAGLLGMQRALEELNEGLEKKVSIGIGLNTGICCVGNLGSRQRFDYSAIGDTVNVASRIEGLTKQYGLTNLIADSVTQDAGPIAVLEVDRVGVVGRGEALTVHTIVGDEAFAATDTFAEWKRVHDRFIEKYRALQFDAAAADIELVKKLAPASMADFYDRFAGRIELLKADPPAPGWDGVFRAASK